MLADGGTTTLLAAAVVAVMVTHAKATAFLKECHTCSLAVIALPVMPLHSLQRLRSAPTAPCGMRRCRHRAAILTNASLDAFLAVVALPAVLVRCPPAARCQRTGPAHGTITVPTAYRESGLLRDRGV